MPVDDENVPKTLDILVHKRNVDSVECRAYVRVHPGQVPSRDKRDFSTN